jgi:polysaccharide export outer membrane protein
MKRMERITQWSGWVILTAVLVMSGCAGGTGTTSVGGGGTIRTMVDEGRDSESVLRSGDPLQIRIETTAVQAPQLFDVAVDDEGQIALPLIGRLVAGGLTTSQVAEKIQQAYVPRYYVRCTATVLAPVRFFYVSGEVKNPNRFQWSKDMTLSKAISTASGFTDFANRVGVELARGRAKQSYNCEELRKHPDKDVPIQPGDSIYIPRSIW